jgi:hypothetical protein
MHAEEASMDRYEDPAIHDRERDDLRTDELDEDAGMIGSETEEPGPGRDQRLTNPDPAEVSAEAPTAPVGMSEDDRDDARLGAQERE